MGHSVKISRKFSRRECGIKPHFSKQSGIEQLSRSRKRVFLFETRFSFSRRSLAREREPVNLFMSLAPKISVPDNFYFYELRRVKRMCERQRRKLKRPNISVRDRDQTCTRVSSSKLTRKRESSYQRSSKFHV